MKLIKKWIGFLYLKIARWSLDGAPPDLKHYVLIAAPHTTNWDLPYMLAYAFLYDVQLSWMGKHTLFTGPFGWFMTWLGGLPVRRDVRQNAVQQMAERFRNSERLVLAVAPEGTRSLTEYWKSGFYSIALEAQVPIVMGFLDYKGKRGGFGAYFMPSGDVKKDMDRLRAFYADKYGKIPENFGPVRLQNESTENGGLEPTSSV